MTDIETPDGSLTVTAASSDTSIIPNGNLNLVDLGGGNWTIEATPALNQNGGPVTITVTVDDGTTTTDHTFDITVTPDNDAPTITAIGNQTILEDNSTGAIAFSVTDIETPDGSLTVTAASSDTSIIPNGNLNLVDLGGGNWTIEATPALNQNGGPVTITVTVDDGTTTTDHTFDITVTPDNDAPTITAIGNQTILEDNSTGVIAFSVTDIETPDGSLTVTAASSDTSIIPNGNLNLVDLGGGNWTIEATPALNQNGGPVTITVTVDDGTTTTDHTFDITVTPDNDAPTITAIGNQTILEDNSTGAIAFSVTDIETPDGSLTVTAASSDTSIIPNGNLNLVDLGGGNWTIEATPALNQNGGPVTITVTVDDGTTTTDHTFDITVTPDNDAPTITAIGNQTILEDNSTGVIAFSVTDIETPDGSLTVTAASSDTSIIPNGNLNLVDLGGGNWTIEATPALNQNGGPVTITVTVDDGTTTTDHTFDITVTPDNDAPTITAIGNQTILEDNSTGVIAFSVTDIETPDGSLTVTAASSDTSIIPNGNLNLVDLGGGNWTIEATPALNQNGGPVTITVTVDDGTTTTDHTFDITVTPDNDAPTITAIGNQTILEDNSTGAIAFSVTDIETPDGSLTVTAASSDTSIIPNGNLNLVDLGGGNWTIEATPALNQNGGPVTITVTVDDGTTTTDHTFDITVTPDNDAPTITPIGNQTILEDNSTGAIAFSVTDIETPDGSLTVTAASSDTSIIPNGNLNLVDLGGGNWTIEATPALNQNGGPVTITVTVDDGTTTTDHTFDITVTPDNDAPTITAIGNQTILEDNSTGAIAFSVTDIETPDGSLTVTAASSDTSIIPNGNLNLVDLGGGNWTIEATPALNQNGGPVTITVTVDDGTTTTDHTFDITVTPDNDAPVASSPVGTLTVLEDASTVFIDLDSIFTDVDDTSLVYSVESNSGTGLASTTVSGSNLLIDFAADQNGSATITVRATDSSGAFGEDTVNLTVVPVNDAPVAAGETYSVDSPTGLTVDVTAGVMSNDYDIDSTALTVTLLTAPAQGLMNLNSDGSFTYTPAFGADGTFTLVYELADGGGLTNTATVTLEVDAFANSVPAPTGNGSDPGDSGSSADNEDDASDNETDDNSVTDSKVAAAPGDRSTPRISRPSARQLQHPTDVARVVLLEVDESNVILLDDSDLGPGGLRSIVSYFGRTLGDAADGKPGISPDSWSGSKLVSSFGGSLHDDINRQLLNDQLVAGTVAVVSAGLTVGYIVWMLRGGQLMLSLMSAVPAWSMFDPLPILDDFDRLAPGRRNEDESLEGLVAHL